MKYRMTLINCSKSAVGILCFGLLIFSSVSSYAATACGDLSGCDRKICEKKMALMSAKQYGDVKKIDALQQSLVYVIQDCAAGNYGNTGDQYQREKQKIVAEYKDDMQEALEEYSEDLAEAKKDGKEAKMIRAKRKYDVKVNNISAKLEEKLKRLDSR